MYPMNAATYAATERLRDGATLQIRALLPSDRTEMLAAVGRLSREALYRRFGFVTAEEAALVHMRRA